MAIKTCTPGVQLGDVAMPYLIDCFSWLRLGVGSAYGIRTRVRTTLKPA